MTKGADLILFAGARDSEAYIAFGASHAFRTDPIVIVPWEHSSVPGRPLAWWHCPDWEALMVNLRRVTRSEEHTSELQSLMRISYAVFCLKKKKDKNEVALLMF